MKLRTIHVGVANRGVWPLEVMGSDERYEPVAIVDLKDEFIAAARAKLNRPNMAAFLDLPSALNAVDADAVIVCTPTATHAALARSAFAAGKHVLVEKGMTTQWSEAVSLVKDAEKADVKFCVAQNYRYHSNERAIRSMLNDKSHPHHPGDVRIVDYVHHRYRPEPRTLNYPYAMVWDMGCHHVDSLSCWLGAATRVTARSYNTPWSKYQHDANIEAIVEYESGAICNYVLTHTATINEWRVILQGERGALRTYDVNGVQFYPTPTGGQLSGSAPVACDVPPVPRSERGVSDDFFTYVTENIEPGISGRRNLNTLAVCEMLVRSSQQKRTVEASELHII